MLGLCNFFRVMIGVRSRVTETPRCFSTIVGVTVPYIASSNPSQPIESISALIPTPPYQLLAQNTSQTIVELDRDVRRTLKRLVEEHRKSASEDVLAESRDLYGCVGWHEASLVIPRQFQRPTCLLDPFDVILFERGRGLLRRKVFFPLMSYTSGKVQNGRCRRGIDVDVYAMKDTT
ncbi:hypothetical protein J3R82DRAFT_3568 [Butyriboletus roseoflavus]|nr:hypothetical protein J3R82DRAFT_3568 [Butyriboletus roseoflavus]